MLLDLSHAIEDGMVTYKGLPAPHICDFWKREDTVGNYDDGSTFQIGRIDMVANTGTYLDTPFHRYAEGDDLAAVGLDRLAGLDGLCVRAEGMEAGAELFEDLDVAGTTIRAGDGVIVATDLANRDPDVYPDPDRLDLTRNPRNHVAFGFGVHQCLGQPLARVELQVVYPTLFRRIPTLARAVPLDEVPLKHDGAVYGVYELPVTWCPVDHHTTTSASSTTVVATVRRR